jgi:hypothetical protein
MTVLPLRRTDEGWRLHEMMAGREQQRDGGHDNRGDRDETANRGARGERAPVPAVLGRPSGAERCGQGRPGALPSC